MPPESPPLPPKPEVALALLQTAASVYVHLDPRGDDVAVPPWFKNQPQLVLQIGLNMAVPIPDLDVGRDSISCTLSFNRRPEFCRIPWTAIYGLVGEDGRGMIWPDSVPPEVASAAQGRGAKRPHLRVADESAARAEERGEPELSPAPKAKSKAAKNAGGSARQSAPSRAEGTSRSPAAGRAAAADRRAASSDPAASNPGAAVRTSSAKATPAQATGKTSSADGARRRELPPYLRVVK